VLVGLQAGVVPAAFLVVHDMEEAVRFQRRQDVVHGGQAKAGKFSRDCTVNLLGSRMRTLLQSPDHRQPLGRDPKPESSQQGRF
jgi:hypothetical protein